MAIKYGELTIIHNEEDTNIFTNIITWMGYEKFATPKSKFVFLFEDGEIYDAENNLKDYKYNFLINSTYKLPSYFEKNNENTEKCKRNIYFYKNPVKHENKEVLDFRPLFDSFNYDASINTSSRYNSIYYCHKESNMPEIFGLLRIKSSEIMPRFRFAYDSNEFTKEEVIYLINYIFNI
jgi:hypothetical protein